MTEQNTNIGDLNGSVVSKETLLNTLKENKEKHDNLFSIAQDNYRNLVHEYANKYSYYLNELADEYKEYAKVPLESLESWDEKETFSFTPFKHQLKLPNAPVKPTSYSHEYRTVMKRIEVSIFDSFKLSENEFQSFIMNNWSWKPQFVSNLMYGCTGFSSPVGYQSLVGSGYFSGITLSGALESF